MLFSNIKEAEEKKAELSYWQLKFLGGSKGETKEKKSIARFVMSIEKGKIFMEI